MIKRWFIGLSAESKGYFTGWSDRWDARNASTAKPSFTKQTALALSFTTEEKANKYLKTLKKDSVREFNTAVKALDDMEILTTKWKELSDQERIDYASKYNQYVSVGNTKGNNQWHSDWTDFPRDSKVKDFDDKVLLALKKMDWKVFAESNTKEFKREKKKAKSEIEFIPNLVVRQCDLELKFNDNEKQHFEWEQRDDNATRWEYCNYCGGAVPSVPQLNIGWQVKICAICMAKLAEQAQEQIKKVSPEIIEHYESDQFLRHMG